MRNSAKLLAAIITTAVTLAGTAFAGSLEPTAAPAPTMKTLDQIPPTWSQQIAGAARFELVLNAEGYLDKETGLVWAVVPNNVNRTAMDAKNTCLMTSSPLPSSLGHRYGWRLPTVTELATLIDKDAGVSGLALPSGHPFANPSDPNCTMKGYCIQGAPYWTSTDYALDSTQAYTVNFDNGMIATLPKNNIAAKTWCVRSWGVP